MVDVDRDIPEDTDLDKNTPWFVYVFFPTTEPTQEDVDAIEDIVERTARTSRLGDTSYSVYWKNYYKWRFEHSIYVTFKTGLGGYNSPIRVDLLHMNKEDIIEEIEDAVIDLEGGTLEVYTTEPDVLNKMINNPWRDWDK